VAIGAIATALTAAGCGASRPRPAAPSPRPDVQRVADVAFQSKAYHADGRAIAAAEQRLIRTCMSRKAFAYPMAPVQPAPPATSVPSSSDGYGLYRAFARRRGKARSSRPTDPHSRLVRYVRSLPPRRRTAYVRALEGSPNQTATLTVAGQQLPYSTGGCASDATDRLWGRLRRYYAFVATRNAVAAELADRLDADRRLAEATAAWQTCMAARGRHYQTPEQARLATYDAYLSSNPNRVHRRELATARADRACAPRSQVYEETARAEIAAVKALPAQQLRALDATARDRARAAGRARALL
jgi:hypothetical protein